MSGHSVLITQCLQRDFVDPVRAHDPLPNRLHIGFDEALRMLGPEPSMGPLAQLMTWARAEPDLDVIHVRDWHDPADPTQHDHLQTFGSHCLRETRGARLVLGLEDDLGPRDHLIDSISLNDCEGTRLPELLSALQERHGPLRIGVVGVWTEAKVSFLLYDLRTRLGVADVATCSALTASNSRQQHFIALTQLQKLLGVTVCDSVAGFVHWLRPGAALELPRMPARLGPRVSSLAEEPLADFDRDIISHLFRHSAEVVLHGLSGGFSGALVLRSESRDAMGQQEAPCVVKLGPPDLIGRERAAFERVEAVLGNSVPAMRSFVDAGGRAGIRYSFAAMGQGRVRTLKAMWEGGEDIVPTLETTLNEVLDPFYAAARYEPLPLLEYYGFARFAADVRARAMVVGDGERLARFYEVVLPTLVSPPGERHYVCTAHGDLNTANILVDARKNVWVIDFFHTGPGHHVLRDVAKLENDLLYILTPLRDEEDLRIACEITDTLRAVEDLAAPLPDRDFGPLGRTWDCLRVLRSIGGRLCREDRDPTQLTLALLRYAVHSLSFEESGPLQRRWALYAATGYAEDVETRYRRDRTLRVDWVDGALGMTICPGRRDRGRDLDTDLDTLAASGVRRLLCLLGEEELRSVGVTGLVEAAADRGITVLQEPVRDQGVPGVLDTRRMVLWIEEGVARGEKVVAHCMGGLGRTGTIAACVLIDRGATPEEALLQVRAARGPRTVENRVQERFLTEYAKA